MLAKTINYYMTKGVDFTASAFFVKRREGYYLGTIVALYKYKQYLITFGKIHKI
jgi:pantothenate kinase